VRPTTALFVVDYTEGAKKVIPYCISTTCPTVGVKPPTNLVLYDCIECDTRKLTYLHVIPHNVFDLLIILTVKYSMHASYAMLS